MKRLLFTFDIKTGLIGEGNLDTSGGTEMPRSDSEMPRSDSEMPRSGASTMHTIPTTPQASPLWASDAQREEAHATMWLLRLVIDDRDTAETTRRFARWGYDRCRLVTMPIDVAGAEYTRIVQRAAGYLGVDAGPAVPSAPVLGQAYEQCIRILRVVPDLAPLLN